MGGIIPMLRHLLAMGAATAAVLVAPAVQAAPHVGNLRDCNGVYSGTYKNVTVQAGESCTLTSAATVLGGVHAKKGAANLFVRTAVARNIQAVGVTGTVIVGPSNCAFDPIVGNNVHVFDSHNVLVCRVTSKNNIMVNADSGEITIRDSVAGNNIQVDRERAYTGSPFDSHANPGWVRIFRNRAGNHIDVFGDSSRVVKLSCCGQPDLNVPLPRVR